MAIPKDHPTNNEGKNDKVGVGKQMLEGRDQQKVLQDVLSGGENFNKTHKEHHTLELLTRGNPALEHEVKELNKLLNHKEKGLHVVGFTRDSDPKNTAVKLIVSDDKPSTDKDHRVYQVRTDGTIDKVLAWNKNTHKLEEVKAEDPKAHILKEDPLVKRDAHNQVTDTNPLAKHHAHIDYEAGKNGQPEQLKTITIDTLHLHNRGQYFEDDAKGRYWANVDQSTGQVSYAKLVSRDNNDKAIPLERTTINPDGSTVTHSLKNPKNGELENAAITHVDSADGKNSWSIMYYPDTKDVQMVTMQTGDHKYHYNMNKETGDFHGFKDVLQPPDGRRFFINVNPQTGDLLISQHAGPVEPGKQLETKYPYLTAAPPEK